MDGSELLIEPLKDMAQTVQTLRACRRAAAAAQLHRDLCNRAALYVLSRERFLLPAWQRHGGGDAGRLQAYAGFKQALAELVLQPPGRAGHAAALAAFDAALQAQHDEDRRVLVPALREDMHVAERRSVFNEIEVFCLTGGHSARPEAAPEPRAARQLLEEAKVVLSLFGTMGSAGEC